MPSDLNQVEIELLRNNSNQLILEIQGLIDVIIYQSFKFDKLNFAERSEIKQLINEELLKKIPQIQKQFQGKALLRTYLSVIIRNICKEIIRKNTKTKYVSYEDIDLHEPARDILTDLLFEEEIIRLKKILELFYKQRNKLTLCLKLMFRIPFDDQDFKIVFEDISDDEFTSFVQQVNPYQACHDITILNALIPLFNKYENKNNSPDALRKWIKQKIVEIIDLLNGKPSSSRYTEETLQILFERCFSCEKDVMSKIY